MLSVERRCAGKRATCSPASAPPAVGRHGRMLGARAMPPLPGALGTGCDIINKTGEAYSDGSRYTGGATEAPNQ